VAAEAMKKIALLLEKDSMKDVAFVAIMQRDTSRSQ
jgi:hypothetical protein